MVLCFSCGLRLHLLRGVFCAETKNLRQDLCRYLLPAAWESWIFNAFSSSAPETDGLAQGLCQGLWHRQPTLAHSILDARRVRAGGVLASRVMGELCSPA